MSKLCWSSGVLAAFLMISFGSSEAVALPDPCRGDLVKFNVLLNELCKNYKDLEEHGFDLGRQLKAKEDELSSVSGDIGRELDAKGFKNNAFDLLSQNIASLESKRDGLSFLVDQDLAQIKDLDGTVNKLTHNLDSAVRLASIQKEILKAAIPGLRTWLHLNAEALRVLAQVIKISGLGKFVLYQDHSPAAFEINVVAGTGWAKVTGPYGTVYTTDQIMKVYSGGLPAPDFDVKKIGGSISPLTVDQTYGYDDWSASHRSEDVYISSRRFADWAGLDTAIDKATLAVISGGATLQGTAEEIKDQIEREWVNVMSWLQAKGYQDLDAAGPVVLRDLINSIMGGDTGGTNFSLSLDTINYKYELKMRSGDMLSKAAEQLKGSSAGNVSVSIPHKGLIISFPSPSPLNRTDLLNRVSKGSDFGSIFDRSYSALFGQGGVPGPLENMSSQEFLKNKVFRFLVGNIIGDDWKSTLSAASGNGLEIDLRDRFAENVKDLFSDFKIGDESTIDVDHLTFNLASGVIQGSVTINNKITVSDAASFLNGIHDGVETWTGMEDRGPQDVQDMIDGKMDFDEFRKLPLAGLGEEYMRASESIPALRTNADFFKGQLVEIKQSLENSQSELTKAAADIAKSIMDRDAIGSQISAASQVLSDMRSTENLLAAQLIPLRHDFYDAGVQLKELENRISSIHVDVPKVEASCTFHGIEITCTGGLGAQGGGSGGGGGGGKSDLQKATEIYTTVVILHMF